MTSAANQLLTAQQTRQKIRRMAYEVYENNFLEEGVVLAGVCDKGYQLAELLRAELAAISPLRTALVRVDFNVPMEDGKVTEDTRLRVALPTINKLRDAGAKVALLAHFDRPKGKVVPSMSLQPVVDDLEHLLGAPVRFASDCVGARCTRGLSSSGTENLHKVGHASSIPERRFRGCRLS